MTYEHSIKTEPGHRYECPHCHSDNYEIQEDGPDDDSYREDYVCNDCGCEFRIWYKLEYSETCYDTPEEVRAREEEFRQRNQQYYAEENKRQHVYAEAKLKTEGRLLSNKEYRIIQKLIYKDGAPFNDQYLFNSWHFDNILRSLVQGTLQEDTYDKVIRQNEYLLGMELRETQPEESKVNISGIVDGLGLDSITDIPS